MIPRCAPPPAFFSSPIPQQKTIRSPSAAVPSSPVPHFVSPISFSSVHRRLPLLLFLLAFLLFVSLAINVFFGAQYIFGNGTFQSFGGCSQFSFSNWHRPKRQIGEKEGGLLAKMEYMWNKPSKHTKFVVGTEDESEVPLFVPLYTQLPQKYLSEICHQRFHKKQLELVEKNKENSDDDPETNRTKQSKTTSREKAHRRKKYREKVCPTIGSFAAPRLVARRMHRQGAAMRRGERWFLTEYDNGYTLFQYEMNNNGTETAKKQRRFTDARMNNDSDAQWQWDFPSHIFTLPEPFRGTDHSVGGAEGDETFFYQSASEEQRIQAVHLGTGKRISKLIYAAKYPLYGASESPPLLPPANSAAADHQQLDDDQLESVFGSSAPLSSFSSSVDLEVDQSALWVLFRRPNLSDSSGPPLPHLTVLKLTLDSMKELAQWDLTQTNADQMVNAFVACAQLFAVVKTKRPQQTKWEGSDAPPLQIVPLFDFQSSKSLSGTALPISAPGWTAARPNSISNVQYDAMSDSLMVFDGGKVYIIKIQRGKGRP